MGSPILRAIIPCLLVGLAACQDPPDISDDLEAYVDEDTGASELVSAGFDAALVERIVRLTDGAEYKRRQYPPGTKIGVRAFGRDRRLPITNRWRENPDSNS